VHDVLSLICHPQFLLYDAVLLLLLLLLQQQQQQQHSFMMKRKQEELHALHLKVC
jgi:hypothetical protein